MGNTCCQSRDQQKQQENVSDLQGRCSKMGQKKFGIEEFLDNKRENQKKQSLEEAKTPSFINQENLSDQFYAYEKKSFQKKVTKDLTYSDQLIKDLYEQTDYNLTPLDEQWECLFDEPDHFCFLRIFAFEWKMSDTSIINILRGEYIVKSSPENFIQAINKIDQLKKIDQKIEKYERFEEAQEFQEYKQYLSYKGMLIVSGRDFVYLKKIKQLNSQKNIWCDVSQSIEDDRYPPTKKKTRGHINLSGHTVFPLNVVMQKNEIFRENFRYKHIENPQLYSQVRIFSDFDLKMNITLKNAKKQIVNEFKGYIEKLVKSINEQ